MDGLYIRNWEPVTAVSLSMALFVSEENRPLWLKRLIKNGIVKLKRDRFVVQSEYGYVTGSVGDYLIDSPGGLYVMNKRVFEDHYDVMMQKR